MESDLNIGDELPAQKTSKIFDLQKCVDVTSRVKRWPYEEYYIGERDSENRKNGQGEQYWSGAESLESYTGTMVRDAMHGYGEYRWRYKDPYCEFVTYEGYFYINQLHGYGVMSYPDGRIFTGLYYKNVRWGPGEERSLRRCSDVGFWTGQRLARLVWKPSGLRTIPDFNDGPHGSAFLHKFRTQLLKKIKIIGKSNSAIELLKKHGCDPIVASQIWPKMYASHCTDPESVLGPIDIFDNEYYNGQIESLVEHDQKSEISLGEENEDIKTYFAWNNNKMSIHMMKHCFQHEWQRPSVALSLSEMLSGPRTMFQEPGKHEYDCRMLLMSSYLGLNVKVAELINECDVFPDVADIEGNTALMYAVDGDQHEVCHFLVECGASVNCFNDSCYTPLGLALMRYICAVYDVGPRSITQALLPPVTEHVETVATEPIGEDWIIKRGMPLEPEQTASSKLGGGHRSSRKLKKLDDHEQKPKMTKKSSDNFGLIVDVSDARRLYLSIKQDFASKIQSQFVSSPVTLPFLFHVEDQTAKIVIEEETPVVKSAKESMIKTKISKSKMAKSKSKVDLFQVKSEMLNKRQDMLAKIRKTIIQLLEDGADPNLVRCPWPAILLAIITGSPEIVRQIALRGVNVNETFPEIMKAQLSHECFVELNNCYRWNRREICHCLNFFQQLNYTPLYIVTCEPLMSDNLEIMRSLLEFGADVNHTLPQSPSETHDGDEPGGPSLMHLLLSKSTTVSEDLILAETISVFLQFNCNPYYQYKGHSAIEMAMLKNISLLNIFILHPTVNLNAEINDHRHTILVKLFHKDFFKRALEFDIYPIITNLLLHGADPLIECYNDDAVYGNFFAFARQTLEDLTPPTKVVPPVTNQQSKSSKKKIKAKKKAEPAKTDRETKRMSMFYHSPVELQKYKASLDLITQCTRLLYIRRIQAKLMKELVDVIYRFKHRTWNMIIKEHDNKMSVALWLDAPRCIEIWDIFRRAKKKQYLNDLVLKHLLCIVQYYQKRFVKNDMITPKMTAVEKKIIDADVRCLLKEHRIATGLKKEHNSLKPNYVMPELSLRDNPKYHVCFECMNILPTSPSDSLLCDFCRLVRFCSLKCMHDNIDRVGCHPCSPKLEDIYFAYPSQEILFDG